MADEVPNRPGPFDVQTIRALIQLMARHDLSEIDLRDGTQRLRLRRGADGVGYVPSPPIAPPVAPAVPVAAATGAAPPPKETGNAAPAAPSKNLLEIKSPAVGTFYASPNPESPPFVRVGDRVSPTTVVGLLEAMKIFNEITADCTGVVKEILVQNQDGVEFNQVLFRVDPAG